MGTDVTVRFDVAVPSPVLDRIIELGDGNSKSLGFLPHAGFASAAADNRIAVAYTGGGVVVGYCLFDLPRDVVRVVHVCVSDDARGRGVARALVDAVSAAHSDRLGLKLKCRADWAADKMWPKLGFSPQTQVRGRSKQGFPLTVWWRSHGHPDLFTALEDANSGGRIAAIDSNIYADLHSANARHGGQHTAVLAPLIASGDLCLALLPSLEIETYATKDPAERARFLSAKVNYQPRKIQARRKLVDQLLDGVPSDVLARDESLRVDASLIAEALANGIDIFITRDRDAITYLSETAAALGVDVLHPTGVPTHLDVEQAEHSYRPAQLKETTFTVQRLDRAVKANEVGLLLDHAGGERKVALRRLLDDLEGRSTTGVQRNVLFDGVSMLQAVWATEGSTQLEVPLFRIVTGARQATLAAQLSWMLRAEAIAKGQSVIQLRDAHVHRIVRATLLNDGFYDGADNGLAALTLPVVGTWPEVSSEVQAVADAVSADGLLHLLDLPENPSLMQTFEFERLWAPAKILGQGIVNYLVPIKRPFASQLLGYPSALTNRPDDLGISREHVYYSSRAGIVKAPARILWYVSGKIQPAVVASSSLVEVRTDLPRRLHRRFARLGVWQLSDIENAANDGRAAAFRFTNTEVFARPIGLDRLYSLTPEGRDLVLRSAKELDDDSFARIYREGMQR